MVRAISPVMTHDELTRAVEPILYEFLEHGDSEEVAVSTGFFFFGHIIHCSYNEPIEIFSK